MKKRILFAVLAMVLVLCGCSMKKAYKKAAPPDMDITEDDTTGNPVKEPEIPGNKADWTILMYVCGSDLESEDGFATDNFNEIKKLIFLTILIWSLRQVARRSGITDWMIIS